MTLLPLTSVVLDIWTEGLRYRLRGEPLVQSAARGVSNEFEGVAARVRHGPWANCW